MEGYWVKRPTGPTSVVFIHGLLSSGESCWRNANGTFWPDLLAPKLDSEGVYVFTYRTELFSGSYRISDAVDALKEFMNVHNVTASSQLIFVCHSMGGIIARKYIVERASNLIATKKRVGIFLIASPSLGSSYANWLSPLIKLVSNSQADALGSIMRSNHWLSDLDKEFVNLKEGKLLKIRGKELIEDRFIVLPSLIGRQVVEPFSGAKYFGEPFKVPDSDHFSIAKPADDLAIQHALLIKFIEEGRSLPNTDRHRSTRSSSPACKLSIVETAIEPPDYAPTQALLRFSITNLTDCEARVQKIELIVSEVEVYRTFRLPRPGAPLIEYQLSADITNSDRVDIIEDEHVQFVLKPRETEPFRLTVEGKEGTKYRLKLKCTIRTIAVAEQEYSDHAEVIATYPIRTVRGLRGGN